MRLTPYNSSINLLAEGKTLRFTMVSPPTKKLSGQKHEVVMHRLNRRELLVAVVNEGCSIVDLSKPVTQMQLYWSGLNSKQRIALSCAINRHRDIENGKTTS